MSKLNNQDKILAELFRAINQNGYLQGDVAEDIVDDVVAQNQFGSDKIEEAEHYLHYEYLNDPTIDGANIELDDRDSSYVAIEVIYKNHRQKDCKLFNPVDIANTIFEIRVSNVFSDILDDIMADGAMLQGNYIYLTKHNQEMIKQTLYNAIKHDIKADKEFGFGGEDEWNNTYGKDNYEWLKKHNPELFK